MTAGGQSQDLSAQKESLKTLLGSAAEEDVNQGLHLMEMLDDAEIWQSFAAGIKVDPKLEIGGLIKGWIKPEYQLHVALFIGHYAGVFEAMDAVDISDYVSDIENLPFQGSLGQTAWSAIKETPLALRLYEDTYPSDRVTDISAIAQLTNLRSLTLDHFLALRKLQPLESLSNLHSLRLRKCPQVRNLAPLKKLSQLVSFVHDSDAVSNIRPLQELVNLRRLELSAAKVSDSKPLQNLTHLSTLVIGLKSPRNFLVNVQSLTELTSLTLYGGAYLLSNLQPLQALTELTSLTIYDCRAQDLSPLKALRKLEELNLGWDNTHISKQAVQAVQSALPKCKIIS